ncbi:MAG: MerR family transcriptional regulator [Solobacterium sp.]|nr:MerR family transcriptional regulator [Solobacterium sp.]
MNTFEIDCSTGNGLTVGLENKSSMKTVKEVCALTGITRKTLFYYDKIGLLKPTARIGSQKEKRYNEEAFRKLILIRIYRKAGFEIEDIRGLLEGKEVLQETIDKAIKKREEMEKQLQFAKTVAKKKIDHLDVEALLKLLKED